MVNRLLTAHPAVFWLTEVSTDQVSAPEPEPPPLAPTPAVTTLVLTGKSPERMGELATTVADWMDGAGAAVPLADIAHTLNHHRTHHPTFGTVCAADREQAVAGLRALKRNGNATLSEDGRTPGEQLGLIHADARRLMQTQQAVFNRLKREMEGKGIILLTRSKLTARDLKHLEAHFLNNVFPVLSPLAIDPAHPFPFIPNTGFSLALELERDALEAPAVEVRGEEDARAHSPVGYDQTTKAMREPTARPESGL